MFPHQRAMDEGGNAGLEEERRLAYVGLTRARKRVLVTFAANRRIYNQWQSALPSRFLDELPAAHVEIQAERGLMGSWSRPARPKEPAAWAVDLRASGDFDVGDRVLHQKFGMGTVRAVDGDKLEIDFDKAGPKKVLDSFVEPA